MRKFIRSICVSTFVGALLGFAIVACTTLEKPQSMAEQVAYAEAAAQASIKTLVELVCVKYAAGQCVDPTKKLHPAQAQLYLEQIGKAREALREITTMQIMGWQEGPCLGQLVAPTACLSLAQTLLTQVQRILTDQQKKAGV